MKAYEFRPFDRALAFLQGDDHHTVACRAARRKRKSREKNMVCYCDLPAHVKDMQDEAMTAASQVVLGWFEKSVVNGIQDDDAVPRAVLLDVLRDARKRFRV